jgi:shikimate kinase
MSDSPLEMSAETHRPESRLGLVLVGFMGAGKTSVGRALGRRLNWPFEDLDDRIEAAEGQSVADIFEACGEAGFRQRETGALQDLCSELVRFPRVVALGGGAFVRPENATLIRALNVPTVFLDAPVEELLRRCRKEDRIRPLCRNEQQFRGLYEARSAAYQSATCKIDTFGKEIEEIAAEVACSLELG